MLNLAPTSCGAKSLHQHIPTNISQGEEAQAADVSAKWMHTVMSAKPGYNSKMERGCRGEGEGKLP